MMVVQPDIAQECRLQFFTGTEVVRAQDIGDAPIEALHHAVGLRSLGPRQPMLDAQLRAELVELMLTCGRTFASGDEAIGEFLAVVGEDGPHLDRKSTRLN